MHYSDRAVVDERQADREQEVDRRTGEKLVDVVELGLRPGKAHQHGKKDEDNITSIEDCKQGEEGTTDEPTNNDPRDDIPLRGEASSRLLDDTWNIAIALFLSVSILSSSPS